MNATTPVLKNNSKLFSIPKTSWAEKVILLALTAFLLLAFWHRLYVNFNKHSLSSILSFIPRLLFAARSDGIYLFCLTGITLVLLYLSRNHSFFKNIVFGVFLFVLLFSLLASRLNPMLIRNLGSPLTYRWLYYSDFLNSTDSMNALKANLNTGLVTSLLSAYVKFFVLFGLIIFVYGKLPAKLKTGRILLPVAVVFLAGYLFLFPHFDKQYHFSGKRFANPVLFFINSALFTSDPSLFTATVPDEYKAELQQANNLKAPFRHPLPDSAKGKIKNVVLFVLESVPARYLEPYGGQYPVTPNLTKLSKEALWFDNAYAHSPTTPFSMVSILSSTYPVINYKGVTAANPTMPLPTLSSELAQKGYRTAFFNAGDIRFQHGDRFLKAQQFGLVVDYRSKHCKDRQFIVKENRWENPDGADDQCLADAFDEWLAPNKHEPFFATLWTVQTHYPYVVSGTEKDYCLSKNEYLNKYLNALHHSDSVLGNLVRTLKKENLYDSTLIVVVGDHGEAFGEHRQNGHGSYVFEENLRVPLFFINPNLFHGERESDLAAQVDIAPSVMEILGLAQPATWQGASLLHEPNHPKRAYFFSPWSDYLFGYREGKYKYIFNASKNTDQVYDLAVDPMEENNISKTISPKLLTESHRRLAAWVQTQNRYFDQFKKVATK